jgi:3-hydroxyacyl-CoA dehydrogenase
MSNLKDALALVREREIAEGKRLHPDTVKLVDEFAAAMKAKLLVSQQKYGFSDNWLTDDWQAECQSDLMKHVHKGDPLDVAAYAAFCWARGWPTASSPAGGDVGDSVALSMDSDMRNSDFETWACKRGYLMHLHEGDESRRYRYSLTEEAWLGWCAALSQSTSAGRVGE